LHAKSYLFQMDQYERPNNKKLREITHEY